MFASFVSKLAPMCPYTCACISERERIVARRAIVAAFNVHLRTRRAPPTFNGTRGHRRRGTMRH